MAGAAALLLVNGPAEAQTGTTVALSPPSISQAEGQSGITYFVYTVTRSGDLAGPTTVQFAVTGSGTSPVSPSDFENGQYYNGTVWFGGGESSKNIWVPVLGDTTAEPSETFSLTLSNPSGATITSAAAAGTITNDDGSPPSPPPTGSTPPQAGSTTFGYDALGRVTSVTYPGGGKTTYTLDPADNRVRVFHCSTGCSPPPLPTVAVSASPSSKPEGTGANTTFTFTVTRSGVLTDPGSVAWSVLEEATSSAVAADFSGAVQGVLNFAANETTKQISVQVVGDSTAEHDEAFRLSLNTPSGVAIAAGQGSVVATITNDDGAPPTPRHAITVNTPSLSEGNGGAAIFSFTVTRSVVTSGASSVGWQVSGVGGSPANGSDFASELSGTVSFIPGEASQGISVLVNGDQDGESDETFRVTLQSPSPGVIATGQGYAQATILNDDAVAPPPPPPPPPTPTVSIALVNGSQQEGTGTAGAFVFRVTRSGDDLSGSSTVGWAVGSAQPNPIAVDDLTGATTGTIEFGPYETTRDLTVSSSPDPSYEPDETFGVALQAVANVELGTPTALATILNDDPYVAPNNPPTANHDPGRLVYLGHYNTMNVVANDTDPDGDPLHLVYVTQGAKGQVSIASNTTVTYRPTVNELGGSDTFTYTISDGRGGYSTAQVDVYFETPY